MYKDLRFGYVQKAVMKLPSMKALLLFIMHIDENAAARSPILTGR